jgi:hypothetical protein
VGDVNGLYWTRLDCRKRKGPEFSGPFVLSGTKLDYDLVEMRGIENSLINCCKNYAY